MSFTPRVIYAGDYQLPGCDPKGGDPKKGPLSEGGGGPADPGAGGRKGRNSSIPVGGEGFGKEGRES